MEDQIERSSLLSQATINRALAAMAVSNESGVQDLAQMIQRSQSNFDPNVVEYVLKIITPEERLAVDVAAPTAGTALGSQIGMYLISPIGAVIAGVMGGVSGKLAAQSLRKEMRREWANEFLQQLFTELRNRLCKRKKSGNAKNTVTYSVLSGFAATIAARLHIDEPAAIGLATLIIMLFAQVTKDALCKTTEVEFLRRLRNRSSVSVRKKPMRKRAPKRIKRRKKKSDIGVRE